MRTQQEIEARLAYLRTERATAETGDGIDVMLLSRSINELRWVLGREDVLNG